VNITKKQWTHGYREQTGAYQWGAAQGILVGEQEVQTTECKTGYKDALYNMGDMPVFCNKTKRF